MKLPKKFKIPKFLACLYFSVFLVFGIIFMILFEISPNNFIFQDDIVIKHKIEKFNNATKLSISYDTLYTLFSRENPRTGDTIGDTWADFYMEMLISKNITHFSIDNVETSYKVVDGSLVPYFYTYEISVYTDPQNRAKTSKISDKMISISKPLDLSELSFNDKYEIRVRYNWIETISIVSLNNADLNRGIPIMYIDSLLELSFNHLDESLLFYFMYIESADWTINIIDFFYFSAVTITTLGFGDILPNSSVTRFFVMFESLLGVILIGCFVSSIFSGKSTENSKL